MRDGVIQRFEFCAELAWKTLREKLIEEGYTDLNSPKAVIRQGYAAGFLPEGELWITLLNDRNQTSHIYDETTADEIFSRIRSQYIVMLQNLAERLEKKAESDSLCEADSKEG